MTTSLILINYLPTSKRLRLLKPRKPLRPKANPDRDFFVGLRKTPKKKNEKLPSKTKDCLITPFARPTEHLSLASKTLSTVCTKSFKLVLTVASFCLRSLLLLFYILQIWYFAALPFLRFPVDLLENSLVNYSTSSLAGILQGSSPSSWLALYHFLLDSPRPAILVVLEQSTNTSQEPNTSYILKNYPWEFTDDI